jgi:hypothetical protein
MEKVYNKLCSLLESARMSVARNVSHYCPCKIILLLYLYIFGITISPSLYCQCYVTFHRCIHPCNHNLLFCQYPDQQVCIPRPPPFSLGSRHLHLELHKLHKLQLITCELKFKHVAQTLIFEKNAAVSQSIYEK